MPLGDGTGPLGQGPMTGRGFGRGMGRRAGRGRGMGLCGIMAQDGATSLEARIGWLEGVLSLLKQRQADTKRGGE